MKVTVVVVGQPLDMDLNAEAPTGHVIARALHETARAIPIGQEWELRDGSGVLLERASPIGAHVTDGALLFLNPPVGAGG